ncbi:hypothetical protein R3I93_019848 [Phoxinus phoxinus]|uniref:Uncharacterized protein n=1 Tax=Phoxinus phoxinus TaxID=58324 RepID=A0AAN9CCC8_9TELE
MGPAAVPDADADLDSSSPVPSRLSPGSSSTASLRSQVKDRNWGASTSQSPLCMVVVWLSVCNVHNGWVGVV